MKRTLLFPNLMILVNQPPLHKKKSSYSTYLDFPGLKMIYHYKRIVLTKTIRAVQRYSKITRYTNFIIPKVF